MVSVALDDDVPERNKALPLMPEESGILLILRSNATSSCIDFMMLDIISPWSFIAVEVVIIAVVVVVVMVVAAIGPFDCSRSR